jgi:hypothetical protein
MARQAACRGRSRAVAARPRPVSPTENGGKFSAAGTSPCASRATRRSTARPRRCRAWRPPRLGLAAGDSAEPWARGSTPTSATIGHGLHVAAVDAPAGIEDVQRTILAELLEDAGTCCRMRRVLHALRTEVRLGLGLGGLHRVVAFRLLRNGIGRPQILLDQADIFSSAALSATLSSRGSPTALSRA